MYYLISLAFLLTSCNYAINLIHTEGSATDMVDDTQDASPDVSPTLSIPMTLEMPKNLTGPFEPIS